MNEYIKYEDTIDELVSKKEFIGAATFPYIGACAVVSSLPRVRLDYSSIDAPKIIREYRTQKQWTQRQLAERSGVSKQTAWSVEQANHDPAISTFEKILNAMGYAIAIVPMDKEDEDDRKG